MSRYGSKHHHKHDPVTPARRMRRSDPFGKRQPTVKEFFLWLGAMISTIVFAVLVTNI